MYNKYLRILSISCIYIYIYHKLIFLTGYEISTSKAPGISIYNIKRFALFVPLCLSTKHLLLYNTSPSSPLSRISTYFPLFLLFVYRQFAAQYYIVKRLLYFARYPCIHDFVHTSFSDHFTFSRFR